MANRLLTFARLAHEVARDAIPERAHRFAPKRYTQPQLLACLLVKEYLRLDYRTAQETLEASDGLRHAIGLTVVPDYSTLWRFAHDKATADVVATALVETVRRFKASGHDPPLGPELVAIDSTGMFCGHASRYFDQRRAKGSTSTHKARAYQKWAAALWVGPQLVTAQLSKPGPCGDYPDLPPLAERSVASVPGAVILADAGYDSEANHVFCREALGVHTLIPAKTRRYVAGPSGAVPGRDGRAAGVRDARRRRRTGAAPDVRPAVAGRDADVGRQAEVGRSARRSASRDAGATGAAPWPRLQPVPARRARRRAWIGRSVSFSTEQSALC